MAIPAYLWLKDDGGADIKGSVDVQGREGSIEVVALDHDVYIPTDNNTGKLTGTRTHKPFRNRCLQPVSLQSCDHRPDSENGRI